MVSSVLLVKLPLSFAIRMNSALGSMGLSSSVSHLMLAKPWSLLISHLHSHPPAFGQHFPYIRLGFQDIKWLWHAQQDSDMRDLPAYQVSMLPVDAVDDVCHYV